MSNAPATIFLVDNHHDSLELYDVALSRAGFQTLTAVSGEEALARVPAIAPDIVVTDVALPGMSGLELVERLRADEDTQDIGIVVVTAHACASDERHAVAAGCDTFLIKPCLPDALTLEIDRILDTRHAAHERARQRIHAEYVEMPDMLLSAEDVSRLCGLDVSVCRVVLDALVREDFLSLGPRGRYARAITGSRDR